MNELLRNIEECSTNKEIEPPQDALHELMEERRFRRAAVNWATHSILTYTGVYLEKALNISKALADFANVMEAKP